MKIFDPARSVTPQVKPMPVLLLLDVSYSMNEVIHIVNERIVGQTYRDGQRWNLVDGDEIVQRIGELNDAVSGMTEQFATLCSGGNPVTLGIITFSDSASQIRLDGTHSFTLANCVNWKRLEAGGESTSLGAALRLAKDIIEDRGETPGRAYRPLVILITDGRPTDDWQAPMERFVSEGRSAKCDRLALMVGDNCPMDVLEHFTQGTPNEPARASKVGEISRFFKYVTMSISTRSRSQNPNTVLQSRVSLPDFVTGEIAHEDDTEEDDCPFI